MYIILLYLSNSCEFNYIKNISISNNSNNLNNLNNSNNSNNLNNLNTNNNIPELANSITSLSFCILGLIGLYFGNTYLYIINMNLLILLGLTSCLHHYFYTNIFFWHADILSIEVLLIFILLNLLNIIINNSYFYKIINFILVTNYLLMLTYNNTNITIRRYFIQGNMTFIVLINIFICYYLYYIKNNNYVFLIKCNLINGLYLLLASLCWYLDIICIYNIHKIIDTHSLWHIFISLASFNTINTIIIYNSVLNNKNLYFIPLLKKIPYITYLAYSKDNKIKTKNSSTYIELQDIKLVNNNEIINTNKNINTNTHRRIKSYS